MSVDAPVSTTDAVTRNRARVQLAWAEMQTAKYAIGMVPTFSDVRGEPGELLAMAERLRTSVIDVAMLTVILERTLGTSWSVIARARRMPLKDVVTVYEAHYQRWLSGDDYPWRPPGTYGGLTPCPADIPAAARELDEWFKQVCTDPVGRFQAPVSGGLERVPS